MSKKFFPKIVAMTCEEHYTNVIEDIVKSRGVIAHLDLYDEFCDSMENFDEPVERTDILYRNFCDFIAMAINENRIQQDPKTMGYSEVSYDHDSPQIR